MEGVRRKAQGVGKARESKGKIVISGRKAKRIAHGAESSWQGVQSDRASSWELGNGEVNRLRWVHALQASKM